MLPESDGGVGGLLFWKIMLGTKHMIEIIASISIRLNVIDFPFSILSASPYTGLYPENTKPGINIPITKEQFRTRVSIWVTFPRDFAENQFADILAWQFNIKGLPIPEITCPAITQPNPLLTNILNPTPTSPKNDPRVIPVLVPYVSITYEAGKVKIGCISAKSNPPKLTMVEV